MNKIETNRFTEAVLNAIAYYFDEDDVKVLYMSDEEYKEFQHDIETAAMYINDLMHNYVNWQKRGIIRYPFL